MGKAVSGVTGVVVSICALFAISPAACTKKEPQDSTYFSRTISPILTTSCVRTNTGAACHVSDDKGNAFGNLDVATFDGLNRRRDLLADYGPYGQPALLLKNVPNSAVQVQAFDGQKVSIMTDIKHTGGPIMDPTASAYQTLRRWIENGASANNTGPTPRTYQRRPCVATVPDAVGFDPSQDPTAADFATFRDKVNPIVHDTCAASNCHGTQSNELYLTCGDTPEQMRWNYFAASEYLAQSAEQSELLRRPLSPSQGGSYHEGGVVFSSQADPGYQALFGWATEHGPPDFGSLDENFAFFAHRVQPVLVKKGCMMLQCHSAAMFHDYRLRGGSGGSFSLSATRRNYTLTLAQLSLESDDINASRLVRKNLYRPEVFDLAPGIAHRGGPLLEDFAGQSAKGALCDANPYDYEGGELDKIPPYCMLREWHRRERAARSLSPLSAIVYVQRDFAQGTDRTQDFDVYEGGADLRIVQATLGPTGELQLAADASVTDGCGLNKSNADIRRPNVSWDGKKVVFAARSSAAEPLAVYEMNADGSACAKLAAVNGDADSGNGLLIHNFDPAYAPPDASGAVRIVFASTRGNLVTAPFDYAGPQRTPADVTKANANLYVLEPDPGGGTRVRQLTFHLNMEREPSFMSDGRVIFTAEKRAPGFAQLALRRINLDGGDYHPLYAQRGSIGYRQASSVVEVSDKNFAAIFSDLNAPRRGGTLAVFNRSIGIDFTSPNAGDYPVDPTVTDPSSASSPEAAFFLHSLRFPDPAASGHLGAPTTGVYASPSPLPNGKLLVSYGTAGDLAAFGGDYDLWVIDPETGEKSRLLGVAGQAEVDAVGVYQRQGRGLFDLQLEEPNAFTKIYDGKPEADVTILDMPVLASLLFQNTPTGRAIETFQSFEMWEDMPPPIDLTSLDNAGANAASDDFGKMYVRRRFLGDVPLASDGSAHLQVPGGLPLVIRLPETIESKAHGYPRNQKEQIVFAPGEYVNQSFRRPFFDGMCAGCHGPVSGRPVDFAVQPDILTQASDTLSRASTPTPLNLAPSERGNVEGAPATP